MRHNCPARMFRLWWTHPSSIDQAQPIPGKFSYILTEAAKNLKSIFVQELLKNQQMERIITQPC